MNSAVASAIASHSRKRHGGEGGQLDFGQAILRAMPRVEK